MRFDTWYYSAFAEMFCMNFNRILLLESVELVKKKIYNLNNKSKSENRNWYLSIIRNSQVKTFNLLKKMTYL